MSSDIWQQQQQHHHYHYQKPASSFGLSKSSSSRKGKRSSSVLAVPNNFGQPFRGSLMAAPASGARLGAGQTSRRATYFGPTTATSSSSNNGKQQLEDNPMSRPQQQQQQQVGDDLISESHSNSQQAGKQHAGPMGIFFKVWSLVKVTKGRHQQRQQQRQLALQRQQNNGQPRLRRQNSEDNSNYSADFPPNRAAAAILQDKHFRRAGSQPAGGSDRLQVHLPASTTASSTGTSSGVSSTTSSTLAANSSGSPSTSSSLSPFRRRHVPAASANRQPAEPGQASAQQEREWAAGQLTRSSPGGQVQSVASAKTRPAGQTPTSKQSRRRHSGLADPTGRPRKGSSHPLALSVSTSDGDGDGDGSRSSSELPDEPEEYDELEEAGRAEAEAEVEAEDEEESNDIYSTPNDSIQSVPSGQRAPTFGEQLRPRGDSSGGGQLLATCQPHPIIKSFSTNNFQTAAHTKQAQEETQRADKTSNHKEAPKDPRQRLSGSRFFISSSSSEDSQATKQNVAVGRQAPIADQTILEAGPAARQELGGAGRDEQGQQSVQSSRQRVSINQGIHSHSGPVRPRSLLLNGGGQEFEGQFLVPMQLLTPSGAPMSPSGATVYLGATPAASCLRAPSLMGAGYQRSPSLFELAPVQNTRFSSKYPPQVSSFLKQQQQQQQSMSSTRPPIKNAPAAPAGGQNPNQSRQSIDSNAPKLPSVMPNSISMYDFRQGSHIDMGDSQELRERTCEPIEERSEYKLAEMMLESGSDPNARDSQGNTTLMLAVLSDNLPAVKCLIEHGANLNETNSAHLAALDLVCRRQCTPTRLQIFKFLIDNGAELDRQAAGDSGRLLDRLIGDHQQGWSAAGSASSDKMAFIECLLESGAKLSSSTWRAAQGKLEIQLSLLRKLCQDGYFLYKQSSIEASVYRFEYALKRIAELEQQLSMIMTNFGAGQSELTRRKQSILMAALRSTCIAPESAAVACRRIKYQTYLGLSRCERKRKFYKRALEFAQFAILVDSSSYEAFYSKAHILKDLGEIDDALLTIDQTARLIDKTIGSSKLELSFLDQQEESLVMDVCFDLDRDSCRNQSALLTRSRMELQANLDYLLEARRYVAKLRQDIVVDKLKSSGQHQLESSQTDQDRAVASVALSS